MSLNGISTSSFKPSSSDQATCPVPFGVTDLGFAMLSRLTTATNAVISPLSIATIVAMLFSGSRNKTRQELSSSLGLSDDAVDDLCSMLRKLSESCGKDVALRSATRLFVRSDLPISVDFVNNVAVKNFASSVVTTDFHLDPEAGRAAINDWVGDATQGLIKELLSPGAITACTVAVAANAIHFKGLWLKPFDAVDTQEADFKVFDSNGAISDRVKVQMMFISGKFMHGVFPDEQFQMILLPYSGDGRLGMLVVLPLDSTPLQDVLPELTAERLRSALKMTRSKTVDVSLPRFAITSNTDAGQVLKELGVESIFSSQADLTGICPMGKLHVSMLIHQAVVEVTEEGTQAAAATGAIMCLTSISMSETFRCDQPFAFAIWHMETSTAVFLGRVFNPSL